MLPMPKFGMWDAVYTRDDNEVLYVAVIKAVYSKDSPVAYRYTVIQDKFGNAPLCELKLWNTIEYSFRECDLMTREEKEAYEVELRKREIEKLEARLKELKGE